MEEAKEKAEPYLTLLTVDTVELEQFNQGTYYYKIIYSYIRDNETKYIGEVVEEKGVFAPYEIGDTKEVYINEDEKIVSVTYWSEGRSNTFIIFTGIFFIGFLILLLIKVIDL